MNPDWLAGWLMVLMRIGGLLAVFPVFSGQAVPSRVRVALGALVAFLVAPQIPAVAIGGWDLPELILNLVRELSVGLLFGFVCRMLFYALEIAGSVITTEIGLSLPPAFNPLTNSQATVPGMMLNYLATVIWLSLDLHHLMLAGFRRSYDLLPIGGAQLSEPVLRSLMAWMGTLFVVALLIAAPVMAVSFLLSLVFAVLGRAVPQMNVFSSSFGIRILAGMAVFGIALQVMARHIVNQLERLPEDVLRLASLLGA